LIWDGDENCEHEWGDLQSCSQLLSFKAEGITFIKHTGKDSTISNIQVDTPTACSFIEIRRETQLDENSFQTNSKGFTSSRKTNPSNFVDCPIAIEYSKKMRNKVFGGDKQEINSFAFTGENTKTTKHIEQLDRPDTPPINNIVISCPLLSNGLCRCNLVSNKLSEFLIFRNEGDSSFIHNIPVSNHETQEVGKFICPLNKKGKIYIPLSFSPVFNKKFAHTFSTTKGMFVSHFGMPSRAFHFFTAVITNNNSSIISALFRAMSSFIEMGRFDIEGFPASFTNLKHTNNICKKCGAVKTNLGLEPFFDDKIYLLPNGNIFKVGGYISHLMQIMAECKRVLKKTGTMWINLGDSYNTQHAPGTTDKKTGWKSPGNIINPRQKEHGRTGVKNYPIKSLIGIPERFAIRMTDELGMIRRNTIIWKKPNCMPSSAKDRYTVDFEYIYFFTKSGKYWFEQQFEPHLRNFSNEGGGWQDGKYKPKENTAWKNDPSMNRGAEQIFNYNPQGRNKRCVWDVTTKPFPDAHFACVDIDTEILTIKGWKKYTEIKKYDKYNHEHIKVATYNLDKKLIEYQPLSYIKEYDFNGELIHIGNRDLDILVTSNHRNIIKKRNQNEQIVLTSNITYSDKIRVNAPVSYPENTGIGKTFAELIGWIISEGHYKKGGWIEIYQNLGKKSERIDYLLKKLEIPHTKRIRNRYYKDKIKNQITWFLKKSPLVEWCLTNIPDKELNQFLISLPQKEIKSLFNGIVGGDGHIRRDDGGYHSTEGRDIYLTKKDFIGIRGTNGNGKNIFREKYNGKIWCPKTPNGTWVARRNGKIFITGNTFPEALVEPMILAGCPEFVCKRCGKAREKIYKKLVKKDYSDFRRQIPKEQSVNNYRNTTDKESIPREELGYTDCGCNAGFDGGIVLDPFIGSGTVGVVAVKHNRKYIGIELSQSYIKMAEKRIAPYTQQTKLDLIW